MFVPQVAQLPPAQRLEPFVDAEVEAQIDLETWEFIRSRRQLETKQARELLEMAKIKRVKRCAHCRRQRCGAGGQ